MAVRCLSDWHTAGQTDSQHSKGAHEIQPANRSSVISARDVKESELSRFTVASSGRWRGIRIHRAREWNIHQILDGSLIQNSLQLLEGKKLVQTKGTSSVKGNRIYAACS